MNIHLHHCNPELQVIPSLTNWEEAPLRQGIWNGWGRKTSTSQLPSWDVGVFFVVLFFCCCSCCCSTFFFTIVYLFVYFSFGRWMIFHDAWVARPQEGLVIE